MFGTEETSNALNDKYKDEYDHVTIARTLSKIDLDLIRQLDSFSAEEEA